MRQCAKYLFRRGMAFFSLSAVLLANCLNMAQAQSPVARHLLVRLFPGESILEIASDYDVRVVAQVEGRDLYELRVRGDAQAADLAQELGGDSRVQYAEEETRVELPEVHGQPFHMAFDLSPKPAGYINQTAYAQIHLRNATLGASDISVTVAVLDTGVVFSHPGLNGRLLSGYNVLSPLQLPEDMGGGKTSIAVGHGTMVAGIVARVAPHARILPIKVLNADGTGTMLQALQGLHYAVTHGAKVINMSFGTPQWSLALEDALAEAHDAGILLVASAGNEASNAPHYPAACPEVLAVASVEANNERSTFSNYGSYVSLVAPGAGIRSTFWTGGYATWSGTSFAAPFVAGEAAELIMRHPTWDVGSIGDRIQETAHRVDKLNPGYARLLGAGLIDMQAALAGDD